MRYRVPYFEPGAPELAVEQRFFPPCVRLLMNSVGPPSSRRQRTFRFPMPRREWRTLTVLPRGWDGSLAVVIDGRPMYVVRRLRWYEIALVVLPLFAASLGPAGAGLGALAFLVNVTIIRADRPLAARVFVCLVSLLGALTNRAVFGDTARANPSAPAVTGSGEILAAGRPPLAAKAKEYLP